jgi:hypothetical protein
MLDTAE